MAREIHVAKGGCDLGLGTAAEPYETISKAAREALADDIDQGIVAARTHYTRTFASAVWSDNVFGVQFHPEKSSTTGLTILRNFVRVVRG